MRLFRAFILGLVLLGAAAPVARAAVLSVQPAKMTAPQDQLAVVEVRLNSGQDVVNAVEGKVSYDPAALEVVEVSKAGSFLTLWVAGPTVDAVAGTVTFTGGVPNGSYVINGRVLSLVFRPKQLGATSFVLDSIASSVRLNDGLGTAAELRTEASVVTVGVNDSALSLTSTTHPQEQVWYATNDVHLAWTPTTGASYAFILADDPGALPDERFGTAVATTTYANVADGAHYFVLRERLPKDSWRTVAIRRVLVDTTSPEDFTPVVTSDVVPGKRVLVFQATDVMSAVVRYTVQEGDTVTNPATSPYILQDQKQQKALLVTAYDAAGNQRQAKIAGVHVAAKRQPYLPILGVGAVLILLCGGAIFFMRRRK
ncbi:MAG: cohesin domain-containing protein [Patescibacteria group bacterium]